MHFLQLADYKSYLQLPLTVVLADWYRDLLEHLIKEVLLRLLETAFAIPNQTHQNVKFVI